jgi:hypothetical protein
MGNGKLSRPVYCPDGFYTKMLTINETMFVTCKAYTEEETSVNSTDWGLVIGAPVAIVVVAIAIIFIKLKREEVLMKERVAATTVKVVNFSDEFTTAHKV